MERRKATRDFFSNRRLPCTTQRGGGGNQSVMGRKIKYGHTPCPYTTRRTTARLRPLMIQNPSSVFSLPDRPKACRSGLPPTGREGGRPYNKRHKATPTKSPHSGSSGNAVLHPYTQSIHPQNTHKHTHTHTHNTYTYTHRQTDRDTNKQEEETRVEK